MSRKFSKQAEAALTRAVRRYNSMRTKAIDRGYLIYKGAPQITSVEEFKKAAANTKQLREFIKQLSDFKTLADFQQSSDAKFSISKGEVNAFKRMSAAANRAYTKRINELREQLSVKHDVEQYMRIIYEIAQLEAKPVELKNIYNRFSFDQVMARFRREQILRQKAPKDWYAAVSADHYCAGLEKIGISARPRGKYIINRILEMPDDKWNKFYNSHPLLDLHDFVYNVSIGEDEKINTILAALNEDILAEDMPDAVPPE